MVVWWSRYRGVLTDVVLVYLVLVYSVSAAYALTGQRWSSPTVVLAVVSGVALLLRRRALLAVAVVATVAGALGLIAPLMVVVYCVVTRGRVWVWVAAACTAAAFTANILLAPPMLLLEVRAYGPALLIVVAVAAGLWTRSHHRLVDALDRQVVQLRTERQLHESVARLSERTRIAAEMHDVLAHRLSLIALHTGVLGARPEQLPEPVAQRLGLLRAASTAALDDLREVLGALREPDANSDPAAPVVREVGELVEQARVAGQHVCLRQAGEAADVTVTHRLAAFRVVQEALSNARKHAPTCPVHISLDWGPVCTLEVTNPLPQHPAPCSVPGYGLVGMRERVESLGGHLDAGTRPDATWVITAVLPAPHRAEVVGR